MKEPFPDWQNYVNGSLRLSQPGPDKSVKQQYIWSDYILPFTLRMMLIIYIVFKEISL
jgi:hypothetical protein